VSPLVLVPLKRLDAAKTRLLVPAGLRRDLVLAMVADVVASATAVAEVWLVSDEPAAEALGVPVVGDAGSGLDAAVLTAAKDLRRPVAVLAGDLPALRPEQLAAALVAAGPHERGVVADEPGGGTVLLTATSGLALRPSYGIGSRRRHIALGAADLTPELDAPGLRRDVDTVADLEQARLLGLGPSTTMVLAGLRNGSAA